MNLWMRLFGVWLASLRTSRLGPRDMSVLRVRVWPHDLDLWGHVNGGRYVTLSDLGRFDLFLRTGLIRAAIANGWTLPMEAVVVRFRRPLRLFNTCELRTHILGWDAKWGYVATDFVRGGEVVASLVMRGTTKDRTGRTVPTDRVLEAIEMVGDAMPVQPEVQAMFNDEPAQRHEPV